MYNAAEYLHLFNKSTFFAGRWQYSEQIRIIKAFGVSGTNAKIKW